MSKSPNLSYSFPSILSSTLKPARILLALREVTSSPKEREEALALAFTIGNANFVSNESQLGFIFTFYQHVLQSQTESTCQPILAVINGPSFSGKTRLIQVLASILTDLEATDKLFLGSNSPAAAIAIGGFHTADGNISQRRLEGRKYVIIDDSHSLSASSLSKLLRKTAAARSVSLSSRPFGGASVILATNSVEVNTLQHSWARDLNLFPVVIHCSSKVERIPSHYSALLSMQALNDLQLENGASPALPLITPFPFPHRVWNEIATSTFAKASNRPITVLKALESFDGLDPDSPAQREAAERIAGSRGPPFQVSHLCVGLPVTVTDGKWKGYYGTICAIAHNGVPNKLPDHISIILSPDLCLGSRKHDTIFTVKATTTTLDLTRYAHTERATKSLGKLHMHRTQIPLIARFAIFESEADGLSFDEGFIDNCRGLRHFKSVPFVLSRFKNCSKIRFTDPLSDDDIVILRSATETPAITDIGNGFAAMSIDSTT
ncbi:hypothetical protein BT96DRAFT_1008877 [Gymnopus androsaceus JB14]|uniref:Uncharacterized protein n=1 Tax=Gymnopus androsaceus JB14 TaxID=1447944 RepID=A0A6A4GE38_9AGAR|nr:hypothetical protein BT96DRAFT_1008877 [Gymnopus androsaceus JB14]